MIICIGIYVCIFYTYSRVVNVLDCFGSRGVKNTSGGGEGIGEGGREKFFTSFSSELSSLTHIQGIESHIKATISHSSFHLL